MKTIISIIIKVALLLALLSATPTTSAQEYIREVMNEHVVDTTIIRARTNSLNIVFNYTDDGIVFMELDDMNTVIASQRIDEPFLISDFEIWNDTLVFCGKDYHTPYSAGLLGFIPLASFPSGMVQYFSMPEFSGISKLEVYRSRFGGHPRIVMLGTWRGSSKPSLIDVIGGMSTGAVMYASDTETDIVKYEDVIVTNNYIVVAAREPTNKVGRVYYIGHPGPTSTFFYGPFLQWNVSNSYCSKMILKRSINDIFAIASISDATSPSRFDIVIANYINPVTHISIARNIGGGITRHFPVCMAYNRSTQMFDLLTNEREGNVYNSVIYHIDNLYNVTGRRYNRQKIESLDDMRTALNAVIGAGIGSDANLWTYMYNQQQTKACADVEIPTYYGVDIQDKLTPLYLGWVTLEKHVGLVLQSTEDKIYKYKCYYDMKVGEMQEEDNQQEQ